MIVLESLIACAVYTMFVFLLSRDPLMYIFNYPPAIVERCAQLNLIDNGPKSKDKIAFYVKKFLALLLFGVILGLLVSYFNDCNTFLRGAKYAYAIWFVVVWFDAVVLDCLWFCHDKHFVVPGTEDMTDAYHDFRFHIKGAFWSMLWGIPAAAVAGLVALL